MKVVLVTSFRDSRYYTKRALQTGWQIYVFALPADGPTIVSFFVLYSFLSKIFYTRRIFFLWWSY